MQSGEDVELDFESIRGHRIGKPDVWGRPHGKSLDAREVRKAREFDIWYIRQNVVYNKVTMKRELSDIKFFGYDGSPSTRPTQRTGRGWSRREPRGTTPQSPSQLSQRLSP